MPATETPRRPSGSRIAWIAILIVTLAGPVLASDPIGPDSEIADQKDYWQSRYHDLLTRRAELETTVARERELYAAANRRNYRRGKKRHVHRDAQAEAAAKLAHVEAQLAAFEDDARRAGALPGWLYEVEEGIYTDRQRPAVSTGPGDEGRNPLYLEKEEEGEDR